MRRKALKVMKTIQMESRGRECPEKAFVRRGRLRTNVNEQGCGLQGNSAVCGWKTSQSEGTLKVRRKLAIMRSSCRGNIRFRGSVD